MKLKTLMALCALGILTFQNAQAQRVKYKVLSDDPRDIKPVAISLEPLYMDLNLPNLAMGWSVRAEALFLKRMEVRANFRRSYFDLARSESSDLSPVKGLKNQWVAGASFAFFLTDRVKKVGSRVVLSSHTSGKYTYTRSISVPSNRRRMFGIRGGAYQMRNPMPLGNDQSEYYHLESEADPTITKKDVNITSMYNSTAVFGGLQLKTIKNLWVKVDGYGTRGNGSYGDIFLDVMFAPILGFSNVVDASDEKVYKVKMESSHVKRIGWRFGWIYRRPESVFMSYKLELGTRPGYATKRGLSLDNETIYMMFTCGINIPMRIKQIDKTNE